MKLSHLLFSTARPFGAVMLCACIFPVIATADEQFLYSAGGGLLEGTVTYAACGDPEPVAWSITELSTGAEWTEADTVAVGWSTGWVACTPASLTFSYLGIDVALPGAALGAVLDHNASPGFVITLNTGSSVVTVVPVAHAHTAPGVPSVGPLGIGILTTLLGIAGIRKLRA